MRAYEVTVTCKCGFGETDQATFTETIDPLIHQLLARHKATGCSEEPTVYDAHGEGIEALQRRMAEGQY